MSAPVLPRLNAAELRRLRGELYVELANTLAGGAESNPTAAQTAAHAAE